jgi:hypothetical protein
MRKPIVTILCSVLIAASSIQMAAAAKRQATPHQVRTTDVRASRVNDQFRNSYNSYNSYSQQFRDNYSSGTCGLFPGPCQ